MGHLLRNTLNSKNIHSVSFKAFALPALFYYVYLDKKNVRNVIYDTSFWKVAFLQFYSYLDGTLNEIKSKFEKDTKYQIHNALLGFRSYPAVAKSILDIHCKHLNKKEIKETVREYLYFPGHSQCGKEYFLPNLNEAFMHNVNKVADMYKIHDMKIMQQSFGETFLSYLNDSKVVIQLLAPDDKVVSGVFDINTRISYDLIVIYYPKNSTADFYALIRKNYTVTLIKEADDPTDFRLKTGLSVDMLLSHRYHRVNLKSTNQTMDVFWENFMTFKVKRLTSYLKHSGTDLSLGEWWREFGLSLMPFYSCIEKPENTETVNKNFCELDEINFLHQWDEDISFELTNSDIRSFLKTVSTTFKSAQLFLTISQKYNVTAANEDIDGLMEKLVLHMEEPGFDLTYLTEEDIDLMQTVINTLKQGVNNSFSFVINILNKMKIFKKSNYKIIGHIPEKRNQNVFIKTENANEDTGYGYRFAFLYNYTVQLRTDYQFKKQIFAAPLNYGTDVEKIYFEVNFKNEQTEEPTRILYDRNNQLQSVVARRWFAGLSVHEYNIRDCNIDSIPLVSCTRHARGIRKRWNLDACIKLALSRNANLTHDQVLETIGKYTFPDKNSICLQFVEEWTNNTNLTIPAWGEQYIIGNSLLLSKLRYQFSLDINNLSVFNGTFRISSIYTYRERKRIGIEEPMKNIIKDFNNQQTSYVATFEDFYAIRNFATTGYTRITRDTFEAKQMKTALYKLAIRQSDDPDEEFDKELFKFESKPEEIVESTLTIGRQITLQKFTTTIVSKESALTLATTPAKGFINILYEFKLPTPYVRAKIKESCLTVENIVILLPGSKFRIESIETVLGVLIVILEYVPSENDKYNWYKKIMKLFNKVR
ncbi:uncharacterized protein LOC122498637 [Leptopilina heterotoma]|uniref:uncharacterized protein LOC122498637 n=1 Tax=Leptopilina heterotoma TaxID=63436 RepID=UPI001CA972E3|nr:uncharacterized protein LOC122498637 [Leptopilina heterotoma]